MKVRGRGVQANHLDLMSVSFVTVGDRIDRSHRGSIPYLSVIEIQDYLLRIVRIPKRVVEIVR